MQSLLKFIPVLALGLLFIFSCEKEEKTSTSNPNPIDTSGNGNNDTTALASEGTILIDDSLFTIEKITVAKVSNNLLVTASTANNEQSLSITIQGLNFPAHSTDFDITGVLATATKVNVNLYVGSDFYTPEYNNEIGTVVVSPEANNYNRMMANGLKLVDNAFAPTKTLTVSANFLAKLFEGNFSLSVVNDTYEGSNALVIEGANNNKLVLSTINQNNKTGSLAIYLPKSAISGTFNVGGGTATDWLNPAAGVIYINAITYDVNGSQQLNNVAQSGTATVTISGDDYNVSFSNLPTDNGFKMDDLSGQLDAKK